MSTGKLLGIGAFALASGLSVNALRYYDELGLLPRAVVDPVTGYRRYRPEQVTRARLICALRRVDVPIDAVRAVLDDPDDSAGPMLRTALERHRQRLLDRADALARLVRTVDHYIEHGVAMSELKSPRIVQITITVRDLGEAVSFYQDAFDAAFTEEISSFQFGTSGHPSDATRLEQDAEPPAVHSAVVRDPLEAAGALVEQRGDERRGNPASPKPPTAMRAPSGMSATAATASTTLSMCCSLAFCSGDRRAPTGMGLARGREGRCAGRVGWSGVRRAWPVGVWGAVRMGGEVFRALGGPMRV